MFENGTLKIRSTRDRPPRAAQRPEPPEKSAWPTFATDATLDHLALASYNPHSRPPLKSANKLDWRPKVGHRTSDEYGSFFMGKSNAEDVLGDVNVARERARADVTARRAAIENKTQTGLGRRLRHSEMMPDREADSTPIDEAVFKWVPRLGSVRTPDGHTGLGRRLRNNEKMPAPSQ